MSLLGRLDIEPPEVTLPDDIAGDTSGRPFVNLFRCDAAGLLFTSGRAISMILVVSGGAL